MIEDLRACIVGAGKMGEALIRGLLSEKVLVPSRLFAADLLEERCQHVSKAYGIKCDTDIFKVAHECNVIVIAVKPKDAKSAAENIKMFITAKQLIITLVSGVSADFFSKILGADIPIVRAMPNVAVLVGEGMVALSEGPNCSPESIALAEKIFSSVGRVAVVDEKHMDAITALSGSGPAYIYTIIEALSDGGVKVGLERNLATLLAAQTTLGAAKMVLETKEHPAKLKDMVTTPGGTTIEGLLQLEEGMIRATLMKAVIKATEKSRTLLTN